MKRVAGVEPLPLPGVPPAHDRSEGGMVSGESPERARVSKGHETPPSELFGRHFIRCLFCRIGDRYENDHFCQTGRDLLVAVLDECYERESR